MKEIDLLKERNDKIDWFSLRNQAAMVNAAAILGNNEMISRIGIRSENDREDIHTTIAKCAIEHADSLINELQKPQFLKQGEQKPAWSEEDESKMRCLIAFLDTNPNSVIYSRPKEEWIKWLKSLRPQSHWKPSEEQMTAIQSAIGIVGELTPTALKLKELREQLKKLTE